MNKLFLTLFLLLFLACRGGNDKNAEKQDPKKNLESKNATQSASSDIQIVSFIYHRFGDSRYPSTNVSAKDFEKQLNYLKTNDFRVMNLSDALKYLKNPGDLDRIIVITIDDGFKSFYENGLPLLEKYDFPATLFINTQTVGGDSYMTWEEIKAAEKAGVEIGNHTHSHDFFLDFPDEGRAKIFRDEIRLSQKIIQENLGYQPEIFAYPYGEFDDKMKEIVKEEGMKAALAQNSGVINRSSDLWALPRFPMSSFYAEMPAFIEKANMNALIVELQSPKNHLVSGPNPPKLEIKLPEQNLQLSTLQCFIQGGKCKMEKQPENGQTLITVQSNSPLNQRRTLYTLTVQDMEGKWHWYSHLFVRPDLH